MFDQVQSPIAACPWRAGDICLRHLTERIREVLAGTLPGTGIAALTRPLTLDALFDRFRQTGFGAEELRGCHAVKGSRCPHAPPTPRYDKDLHELWAGDEFLHRFSDQAVNEVAILEKFEKAGWPRFITEPLGRSRSVKYGAWLMTTVTRLNQCQRLWLIQFHSHPSRRTVTWEWRLLKQHANCTRQTLDRID